jgi:hypothetical protein
VVEPIQRKARRAEHVYQRMRDDIFAVRLSPGQRLKFTDLCATYDTSVGVAREVLVRLAAEHLVVARDQQGYIVVELSESDLLDLTQARLLIEPLVLRESVLHGDADWETGVVAAHYRLTRIEVPEDMVALRWRSGARRTKLFTGPSRRRAQAYGCKRPLRRCGQRPNCTTADGGMRCDPLRTGMYAANTLKSLTPRWLTTPTRRQQHYANTSVAPPTSCWLSCPQPKDTACRDLTNTWRRIASRCSDAELPRGRRSGAKFRTAEDQVIPP